MGAGERLGRSFAGGPRRIDSPFRGARRSPLRSGGSSSRARTCDFFGTFGSLEASVEGANPQGSPIVLPAVARYQTFDRGRTSAFANKT
jgi:hypothetical protein